MRVWIVHLPMESLILESVQCPSQAMKMDHLIQHHDSLVCTEESSSRCHPFSMQKKTAMSDSERSEWLIWNISPIYCNDADSSHSIWHCPSNCLLLRRVNRVLERMLREIVAYIQIYCTAYMRQPWPLSLYYSPDKCNTLNKKKQKINSSFYSQRLKFVQKN